MKEIKNVTSVSECLSEAPPHTVRLSSGRYINVSNLTMSDICIEDIAHALAMKPRFNGNILKHYSIALHSIAVAVRCPVGKKLQAILHDASEAYLFDIPTPYKSLPEFKDIVALEKNIQFQVYDKYLCRDYTFDDADLKKADKAELQREWKYFMLGEPYSFNESVLDTLCYNLCNAVNGDILMGKILFIKEFIKAYEDEVSQGYCDDVLDIREEIEFLKEKYNL